MRIRRIFGDLSAKSDIIRASLADPRHPSSIPAISVSIRSIRIIRVLFLFTNKFYMHPTQLEELNATI